MTQASLLPSYSSPQLCVWLRVKEGSGGLHRSSCHPHGSYQLSGAPLVGTQWD